jgi:L-fuconolactonase
MRIDAHQHFWTYSPQEYGWINSDMAVLKRDRLPDDLLILIGSAGIGGTVAVQARQTVAETSWLLELADQHAFIKGVVGWVDLCSAELRSQLSRLSAHPKFRGVRHVVQDEPDDRFLLREDFLRGLGMLAEFGLTFDILIFPRHLARACDLVARFPEQRFVLDHIAKPRIKDGLITQWAVDVRRLAAFPNVFCKVSGMVTEADWQQWQQDDFRPYLEVVLEAFGVQRTMFGSDWPVCTLAGTYADVVEIISAFVGQLPHADQVAFWGETAQRFYGLG